MKPHGQPSSHNIKSHGESLSTLALSTNLNSMRMQLPTHTLSLLTLAVILSIYSLTHTPIAHAQAADDFTARQEIEAARLRLLKAIDEIENMKISDESQRIQLESLYKEITQLKDENKKLRNELNEQKNIIQELKASVEKSEKALNAQREVLVSEVSRLSVETKKKSSKSTKALHHASKQNQDTEEEPLPDMSPSSAEKRGREYYVHEVKRGQTLFSIVQAYRDQGATDATLQEVLEENNLKKNDILVAGQKIYIPKSATK